ncbi:hypothetical protein SERLA73DRAFT_102290 [Serpula lacrymans var. lacrymans S7.3]|uniref:Molybdate-anion transporter n=2 Tax=Serpula lacrymans var. lacrymans TaxID=341189 RepID=F8PL25_SERL3|nr:uncharacterized protein SERLADRAFT_354256 [Serpula lacrymans var. lacrymans S7.9]EGO03933.1 hypothetical protein SERLA73DRAFT_102290 [Serpula lacrymans var. lacrymans S7.3]EGO29857.1 hypothetical protein SERLADRAFT_354256 [Serpula lacrymans var. lacrymans S7.9]
MVAFYELQLILLVSSCLVFLLLERHVSRKRSTATKDHYPADRLENGNPSPPLNSFASLTRQYIVVYAIVMGADWLQGPYVYSLYREQYAFPERTVAVLFVTGFVSAGITAPLVGVWADQHGRKKLCLTFCITYTATCLCILFPYLPVLLCGRVLGGISTSILYSAFESWLVSSSNSLTIPSSDLSTIMGRATLVNGFVATGAGIASNQLVTLTNSFATPFMASGVLLLLGFIAIRASWAENYGSGGGTESTDIMQLKRLRQAWQIVRSDPLLLVIGLTQTCFEGSMYLFVFLWVPALQEASPSSLALPLGYIFSSFMISMMLGSLLYTAICSYAPPPTPTAPGDSSLALHAKLSSLVCAVSALALAVSIRSDKEKVRFWAFCAFEACVGMYNPVQGMLRGTLISNEHRATLSSLFRVPLNIFVVVSLLTGVSSARYAVLSASSLMLAFSSLMTAVIVVARADDIPTSETHLRPA